MYESLHKYYWGRRTCESAGVYVVESSLLEWDQVRSGVDVPDWKKKIAHLQSASSPYSITDVVEVISRGKYSSVCTVDGMYPDTVTGLLPELPDPPVSSQKAYEEALGNFLSNAGKVVSPVKGMVFLGELRETLRMLRSPAKSLRDGINTYLTRAGKLRRKGGNHRRLIKGIADLWLENAYGLQPLLNDIKGAAEAYKAYEKRIETSRVHGVAVDNDGSVHAESFGLMGWRTFYIQERLNSQTSKTTFKGVVKWEYKDINASCAEDIANLSGFKLTEFVPTLWELTPYSMLVDYFSNIGQILNSIHGLLADWVWVSVATKNTSALELTRRLNHELLSYAGYEGTGGTTVPFLATRTSYTRDIPALRLPNLTLTLMPTGFQWANMGALLVSQTINTRR